MTKHSPFPSLRMRVALLCYTVLWVVLFPLILFYLWWRGRKDPAYRAHIPERFGFYPKVKKNSVWIHAVSLGEMRSAAPLVQELLDRGETIVTTHFTPAGRKSAHNLFPDAIGAGKLVPVYVPFEFHWCYRRFFNAFAPKYGLVMEIEIWPRMIASTARCRVPLFMCNAQYPERSFNRDRDKTSLRGELTRGFAGLFVKSQSQVDRFEHMGASNIAITGELRFEQPIGEHLLSAARAINFSPRPVITLASVVENEDESYLHVIKTVQRHADAINAPRPLFIYVPRAPERFASTGDWLTTQGQTVQRRGQVLSPDLETTTPINSDILLGDSMGEMYFYLELANAVIVGGGFHPKGAHNVIEPLALKKPVYVGPEIWTIEYPAHDAIAAGVLAHCTDTDDMAARLINQIYSNTGNAQFSALAEQFNIDHSGATQRTLAALPELLKNAGYTDRNPL
ncbi:hypothetical protein BFP76_01695 [Amylibacter kogurei]|uniref:3-deoxy-D-manno-octulosonic acid transferase n=1 Tax=Paramylibacter kogurei TaxID=1889778 RepID=A0A2G5K4F3_9RHOB|nr:glycosyltransferase N-terminal domain-containing protein [Amylibacter kogurei]PIB23989.1 hypothetical protein BFP76_01695 [Amylibacter kogurei]